MLESRSCNAASCWSQKELGAAVTNDHLSSCIEPNLIRARRALGSSDPKGREEPNISNSGQ